MKLADLVLRCLVRRRDRLTISGDLLEVYHDEILPTRGPIGGTAAGLLNRRNSVRGVRL